MSGGKHERKVFKNRCSEHTVTEQIQNSFLFRRALNELTTNVNRTAVFEPFNFNFPKISFILISYPCTKIALPEMRTIR